MGIKVEGMSWNTAHVASMSEKEFVDLHMKDSGVYPLLSEADKIKALKLAHNTVVQGFLFIFVSNGYHWRYVAQVRPARYNRTSGRKYVR